MYGVTVSRGKACEYRILNSLPYLCKNSVATYTGLVPSYPVCPLKAYDKAGQSAFISFSFFFSFGW